MKHIPVLLKETINSLKIKKNGKYLDGTFGFGGHSLKILKKIGKNGKLYAIDRDPESFNEGKKIKDNRFEIFQDKFSNIKKHLNKKTLKNKLDGILLDLGVSSPQIDKPYRGFSFLKDGPLDMRMNQNSGIPIYKWLQKTNFKELSNILKIFGEERFSKKIAFFILKENKKKKITRTKELSNIIYNIIPFKKKFKHPATRTFQALRIYINEELKELKKILDISLEILKPGGRLSIISFHSLEDRIIKKFFKKHSYFYNPPIGLPITEIQKKKYIVDSIKIFKKIKPKNSEIKKNPRSRSAILRTLEMKLNK